MLRRLFRNRWVRGTAVTVLILLLVVTLVSLNAYYTLRHRGERHQQQALAELDATDPGWRFEAIQAARHAALPPAEKNVVEQAMKLSDRIPDEQYREWLKKWPPLEDAKPGDPPTHEELTHCRKLVGLCVEVILEARELRHLSGGVVVPLAENPIGTMLPHLDKAGRVETLLRHDATVSAAAGRTDDALDDALAILALARGFDDEPFLVSQLFRLRFLTSAVRVVERTLRQGEASDAKLAEVQEALAGAAKVRGFVAALRGERAGMTKMAELLERDPRNVEGLLEGKPPPPVVTSVATSALLPETHARYLELMTRAIAVAEKPPGPDRNAEFARIEADLKADTTLEGEALRLVFPAVVRCYEADVKNVTLLWMAVLAVKAERHRLKTGSLPEIEPGRFWEPSDFPPHALNGLTIRRQPAEWWCVFFKPEGPTEWSPDGPKTDQQIRLYDVKHRKR